MKKVIISGATSMIGMAILNECIRNEVEVLAIIRKDSTNLNRIPNSNLIEIIECDLNEIEQFPIEEYNEKGYDIFYHCAWGNTEKQYRNDAVLQNYNVKYTLDAVKLCERLGCRTFIGAGSQAEYGRVGDIISPETPNNPDSAYGITKYTAGKLSRILCRELGIRHIWGRIFSVYGLYDNKNTMIMYAITGMLEGIKTQFTNCEQEWDYLYSEDVGRAFYLIGLKGCDGSTYCIGSGETRKLNDYVRIIHNSINDMLPLGIGEKEYALDQVMKLCADISTLTNDTGFVPKYTFEEGISKTIEWVKSYDDKIE